MRAAGSNPLRGRDEELASLRENFSLLRSGAGTCWLIEGGPGLGRVRHRSWRRRARRCRGGTSGADARAVRRA
jgi:hypothetical protein